MEFGSPHLSVREPIAASSGAPPKVKENLAKRRVSIVGDWHLWIQFAQWEIHTASASVRSQDAQVVLIQDALSELDGQILLSANVGKIYSVYARTRKTEALNFSISAALSDSDFRVLA